MTKATSVQAVGLQVAPDVHGYVEAMPHPYVSNFCGQIYES